MEPLNKFKQYQVSAKHNPWGPGIDLLVTYHDGGNVHPVRMHVEGKVVEGEVLQTTLTIGDSAARTLMTMLWDAGVRPDLPTEGGK